MKNWTNCNGTWKNLDHYISMAPKFEKTRNCWYIEAEMCNNDSVDIFDLDFDSEEEAHEFLENFMNDLEEAL